MFGLDRQAPWMFDLGRPKEISLQYSRISFDKIFYQLTGLIDTLSSQHSMLNLSGVDDGIYRVIVMMLNPHLITVDTTMSGSVGYGKKLS